MKTVLVYASMSGKTERMADYIADKLRRQGFQVDIKEAANAFAEELNDYEQILIGSYTWGDGELPDEAVDFYEELKSINCSGKIGAVFGAGDSSYRYFARAVDIWEEALQHQGCKLLVEGLKIDGEEEDVLEASCESFCRKLVEAYESEECA